MSTTGKLGRQAPTGHHWVWRPTDEVEPGHCWTVMLPGEPRSTCRYGFRPSGLRGPGKPACGQWPVARLTFTDEAGVVQRVDYCEDHLFSREIRGGVLHTCVLRKIESEAA